MRVNATTVTTGIMVNLDDVSMPIGISYCTHPKSVTRVNGNVKRYNVTHCLRCMESMLA